MHSVHHLELHISTQNRDMDLHPSLPPDMRIQPCQEGRDTSLTARPAPSLGAAHPPFCRPPGKCVRSWETVVLRRMRENTHF